MKKEREIKTPQKEGLWRERKRNSTKRKRGRHENEKREEKERWSE